MSDPTFGAGESGASRVEAMLAAFSRQGAPEPPPADAPAPPPAAAGDARAAARSAAVRPLWSAGGAGASSRPWSQWLQWRPLWALLGVVVGVLGTQLWHELRQQEQRDTALASVSRSMQGTVRAEAPVNPMPLPAASPPSPVLPSVAPADEPAAASSLPPPPVSVAPATRIAPTPAVRPSPAVAPPKSSSPSTARAAPAARPAAKTETAAKRPPPSPAAVCKNAKGAEFERCLQIQCRKDRYFAHRHCIALYERAIRP